MTFVNLAKIKKIDLIRVFKSSNKKVGQFFNQIRANEKRLLKWLGRRPMIVVATIFITLIVLILAGAFIRSRRPQEIASPTMIKKVNTYQIGSVPMVTVMGEVEKTNVIKIVAQTAGIVNKIYVNEGDHVDYSGIHLAYIATNYQGGNAASIQRQLAEKQFKFAEDNFNLQKDLITKRRDIANNTDANADQLRDITQQSVDETKSLIGLNEDVLSYLDRNIELYEASNSADSNRDLIYQTKQLKTNYLSALNQLKSALRNSEYQVSGDNPPARLSDLSKDLTLKQLEVEEKSLELNKEISQLQYRLAQVQESLSFPASPCNGDIERVHVRPGQAVNPGTVLFTMKRCEGNTSIQVFTSKEIAASISQLQPSILALNDEQLQLFPEFISNEPVEGHSYMIRYILPDELAGKFGDRERLSIQIPIGYPETSAVIPFIPIDAVYQTREGAYVYLIQDGKVVSRLVEVGVVYGQFIEVRQGLESADQVILDRSVIVGEEVEAVGE